MIEKVRLKTQIIWYFTLILIVVKITRPLRSYRTPKCMEYIYIWRYFAEYKYIIIIIMQ